MSLRNFGRASALSPFQREEAVRKVFDGRNAYTKMFEDEALMVIRNDNKD